jgi:hypothetical protein
MAASADLDEAIESGGVARCELCSRAYPSDLFEDVQGNVMCVHCCFADMGRDGDAEGDVDDVAHEWGEAFLGRAMADPTMQDILDAIAELRSETKADLVRLDAKVDAHRVETDAHRAETGRRRSSASVATRRALSQLFEEGLAVDELPLARDAPLDDAVDADARDRVALAAVRDAHVVGALRP